jgi:cytochrome c oxidase subunit 2
MMDWLPQNVSTYGGEIDSILYLIYYVIGAWFILLHVLIFWFLFRYRNRKGHRATYVTGNSLKQAAWILVPGLIVLCLDLYIDYRGSHVWATVKQSSPEPDVTVGVVGKQFNWEMIHPGPDDRLGTDDDLMIENDLHVPVDSVVQATLTSRDVIHSFFLPELRLKQDTLPGRQIQVWFEVTKPGRYEIACAELCGFGHSGMKGHLYVHTPEDYEKWKRENWPPS